MQDETASSQVETEQTRSTGYSHGNASESPPQHGVIDYGERLAKLIPPPESTRKPSKPVKYAVGIVAAKRPTAPEGVEYLTATINSIRTAGFDDITIFAEPETPGIEFVDGRLIHGPTQTPVTMNGERLGVVPNHLAAMMALTRGQKWQDCTAFIMVEDDVLFCQGMRRYLDEYVIWPMDPARLGAISLSTQGNPIITKRPAGWHHLTREVFPSLWGAQALLFSRTGAERWVHNVRHTTHRENSEPIGNYFVDWRLTEFCRATKRPILFSVGMNRESLCAHVGHYSTVYHKMKADGGLNGREKRWAETTITGNAFNANYTQPVKRVAITENRPPKPQVAPCAPCEAEKKSSPTESDMALLRAEMAMGV